MGKVQWNQLCGVLYLEFVSGMRSEVSVVYPLVNYVLFLILLLGILLKMEANEKIIESDFYFPIE
jgi:hypothetical protein